MTQLNFQKYSAELPEYVTLVISRLAGVLGVGRNQWAEVFV